MTQFDILLRRALMDANLAQYEQVLQDADALEPDASPSYLQERTHLLADPWGWEKRQSGPRRGRRVNWRLIAVIAALLLLSACAYAAATGQFSQWFPKLAANPAAPETSEELLGRMGTVIEESQTVNGETVTLNAAVWDGETLMLSLTAELPDLPDRVAPSDIADFSRCWLEPVDGQREAYVRADVEAFSEGKPFTQEQQESTYRKWLADRTCFYPYFSPLSREGTTLAFEVRMELIPYLEETEMTLHLENILATDSEKIQAYAEENGLEDGGDLPYFNFGVDIPVLKGPFDFTFTPGKSTPPINYACEIPVSLDGIPLRFTGFKVSFYELTPAFVVPAPVNIACAEGLGKSMSDPDLVDGNLIHDAVESGKLVRGFWTANGGYVDCSGSCGRMSLHSVPDWTTTDGSFIVKYPHILDPATVTALDVAGIRVELSELERVDE